MDANLLQEEIWAHIRIDKSGKHYQSLEDHIRGVANYAEEALSGVSLSSTAYLAGLLHDAGKATLKYQEYLKKAVFEGDAVRGSVNHTFAGVRFLLNRYHDSTAWGNYAPLTSEIIAYAIGAHHGQFDCVDIDGKSGFQHRLDKEDIDYDEAIEKFLNHCVGLDELDEFFKNSVAEVESFIIRFLPALGFAVSEEESLFFIGMLSRLVNSAVIEGDRRDTAEFMENFLFPAMLEKEKEKEFWRELSDKLDNKIDSIPIDNKIGRARQLISCKCREIAAQSNNLYRLNVPTGAGKTLSSLRFALAHAAYFGKKRIIYVSPLLSILEQNADVIRNHIQDDSIILEHHSNVVNENNNAENLEIAELMTATWDAPVIITTLVQLLNTLFQGNGTCIRRFHSLCNSIIIIDEVQTVPSHLLSLFNMAVSFLTSACNAAVVLCSATQPCSEAAEHPICGSIKDMISYDDKLWKTFKRTNLIDAGVYLIEEIPVLADEVLAKVDSLLIICNKKSEAELIYGALPKSYNSFYLSASMCVAHRRKSLSELMQALKSADAGEKIVCVSTQVIEAGVDISFASVIRLLAGMDSMVQAAGRCNRNGESDIPASVYIVNCSGEELGGLPEIQRGKNASLSLLEEYSLHPEVFDKDLTSDTAIRYYYRNLYQKEMPIGLQDGSTNVDGRKTTLFSLLSDNHDFIDVNKHSECEKFCLRQGFKTAGQKFSVYKNDTTDVVVPYGQGQDMILKLLSLSLPKDFTVLKSLLEEIKPYTVSLYSWQLKRLESENALISVCDGKILILKEGYYDETTGFKIQRGFMEFKEV